MNEETQNCCIQNTKIHFSKLVNILLDRPYNKRKLACYLHKKIAGAKKTCSFLHVKPGYAACELKLIFRYKQ